MTRPTLFNLTLATTLLLSATAAPGYAYSVTPAIDFTPTRNFTNYPLYQWSLGFEFTTNRAIEVTALGFYDDLKNDLVESHEVGVFNQDKTLLGKAIVNPGDLLEGWFRYTSLQQPIQLAASQTYYIAALTKSEQYTWSPSGFVTDPSINYVRSAYTLSSSLVFPNPPAPTDNNLGYFGPNFKVKTGDKEPVPEPFSVLGSLTAGLFGLRLIRKRRQKKATPD